MSWIRGAAGAIAGLAAAGLFALPAAAQTVYDPLTTQDVQRLLERKGMTVEINPSDGAGEGEYVVSKFDNVSFWIHFTSCDDDGSDCGVIVFDAGFSYTDNSSRPTVDDINEWNEYHLGKAGLDKDGNPYINIEVNVIGGITRANLEETLDWWDRMLDEFTEYVGWD